MWPLVAAVATLCTRVVNEAVLHSTPYMHYTYREHVRRAPQATLQLVLILGTTDSPQMKNFRPENRPSALTLKLVVVTSK